MFTKANESPYRKCTLKVSICITIHNMRELFGEKFHNDWVISLETSEEEAKSD